MERQTRPTPVRPSSRRAALALAALLSLALPGVLAVEAAAPTQAPAPGGLVPLPIQLPKPMFEGPPQNLSVPNLQKPLGKPREPSLAPAGVVNVATGKKVTSSDMVPVIGEIEQITDTDRKGAEGSFVELGPGVQWVQVDLGAPHEIYAVLFWHFPFFDSAPSASI